MAGLKNHYERAFSAWLNDCGLEALGVDERTRPIFAGRELKNFDFLVNGADRVFALDLKGRRSSPWITQDDLFSLMSWRSVLRGAAEPALLFAFYAPGPELPARLRALPALEHREPSGIYRFALLHIEDAQRLARERSAAWHTYGFEWGAFCRAVVPADKLLLPASCAA